MDTARLSEAICAEYHERGFVLVPQLVSAQDLPALREYADIFVRGHDDESWQGAWGRPYGYTGRPMSLTARHGIHKDPGPWRNLVTASPLRDLATALAGRPLRVHQTTAVYKPPVTGQPFPLHQDVAFYGQECQTYVIAVVHLDETPPESGPLQFVPGAHRGGQLKHIPDRHPYLAPRTDTVEVPAHAGDVVFFGLFTPHGSTPNRSALVRRTVRLGFCEG